MNGPRTTTGAAVALAALAFGAGAAVAQSARSEAPAEGAGRYVHVSTDLGQSRFVDLTPGETASWYLAVTADAPEAGAIARTLRVDGSLAELHGAALLEVRSCDRPFVTGACPGTGPVLLPPTPADVLAATGADLGTQRSDEPTWLAVLVTLDPAAGDDAQSRSLTVSIGARGGSLRTAPQPGSLPRTGADLADALLLATVAVGTGLGLTAVARRRTDRA